MLAEEAEREAKMQLLDDALTAKGLPPYNELESPNDRYGKLLLEVLFADKTRLRNLESGRKDEPLELSELSTAVDDCVIVHKNIMKLQTALAKIQIPGFCGFRMKFSCYDLLVKDPELAIVFKPTSPKTAAVAIKSALPRLTSQLQKFQGEPNTTVAVNRCVPSRCQKCEKTGVALCGNWELCSNCCYDRFCSGHESYSAYSGGVIYVLL